MTQNQIPDQSQETGAEAESLDAPGTRKDPQLLDGPELLDGAQQVDGPPQLDGADALVAALLELERHVGEEGWDQSPRLFALVRTDAVILAEPQLADQLGLRSSADGGHPDALTAIEQDHFEPSGDLLADLSSIVWPEAVHGCALSLVSSFLPADAEVEIPDDPEQAAEYVAHHELQQEMRVVVGIDRDEHAHGVARLRSEPDELLGAPDLIPGLTEALARTLAEPDDMVDVGEEK